jgi:hypothetical protein
MMFLLNQKETSYNARNNVPEPENLLGFRFPPKPGKIAKSLTTRLLFFMGLEKNHTSNPIAWNHKQNFQLCPQFHAS